MKKLRRAVLGALIVGAALVGHSGDATAAPATWERTQDIGGSYGDIALDGNRMAVARFSDTYGYYETGVVDVLERSAPGAPWAVTATIERPAAFYFQYLSNMQVALDRDTIIVRAGVANGPGFLDDREVVLVYEHDATTGAWAHAANITPAKPNVMDIRVAANHVSFVSFPFFCSSTEDCQRDHEVSVEGWTRISDGSWVRTLDVPTVRSQFPSTDQSDGRIAVRHETGILRVFEASDDGMTWTQTAQLAGPPGRAVAVDGDRIVAVGDTSALIYERAGDGTWALAGTVAEPAQGWGPEGHLAVLSGDAFSFASVLRDGYAGKTVWVYERDPVSGVWQEAAVPGAPVNLMVFGLGIDGGTAAASFGPAGSGGGGYPQTLAIFQRQVAADDDGDGIPNGQDPDDDGDGAADVDDAFPNDPAESVDSDGDGIGNNADADDDGDLLPDAQDPAPLDADADDDGITDGRDVEHIQAAVEQLPSSAFRAPGQRRGLAVQLDQVEAMVAIGDEEGALRKLQELRRHVDGCGLQADGNDWIRDCAAQLQLRERIDLLIANLQAP